MRNVLGTLFLAASLFFVTACSSEDGVDLLGPNGDIPAGGGAGGGGAGSGGGAGGTAGYSVSLTGVEVQKKGSTETVAVTGLPVNGATVTGP